LPNNCAAGQAIRLGTHAIVTAFQNVAKVHICVEYRMIKSQTELEMICLESLKMRPGFEYTTAVRISPRDVTYGNANWQIASIRPRIDAMTLRTARDVIGHLQGTYKLAVCELEASEK
jgi:hypothetical protein